MEMEVLTWSNITLDHWLLQIHEIMTALGPALPFPKESPWITNWASFFLNDQRYVFKGTPYEAA